MHFLTSVNALNFAQLFYGLLSLHFACFRCQLKVCEVFSPAILSLYGLNLFTKSYGFQKLKHLIDSYHETCNLSKFGLLILDLPDISFAQTKFHWKTYNTIFFLSLTVFFKVTKFYSRSYETGNCYLKYFSSKNSTFLVSGVRMIFFGILTLGAPWIAIYVMFFQTASYFSKYNVIWPYIVWPLSN